MEDSPSYNSMPATWCAARLAEARAWVSDVDADPAAARTHVIELLSQLDSPPLAAASVGGGAVETADWLPAIKMARQQMIDHMEAYDGSPVVSGQLYLDQTGDLLAHVAALTARLTTEAAAAGEAKAAHQADLDKWGDYEHKLRNELQAQIGAELSELNGIYEGKLRDARAEAAEAEREKPQLREELRGMRAVNEGQQVLDIVGGILQAHQKRITADMCHRDTVYEGLLIGLIAEDILKAFSSNLLDNEGAAPLDRGTEGEAEEVGTGWCAKCTAPVFGGGTHCSTCAAIEKRKAK